MSNTHTHNEHTCVVGLGWGDEGKGKVVDLLCPHYDFVVRFNGGANAGHTVYVGDEKFALHLLPSGVLHADKQAVVGSGVVVDPIALVDEIEMLSQRGIDIDGRLHISDRAHVVLAYHKTEDLLSESAAGDSGQIGTTSRGIGPCYADKMRRTSAIRMSDLRNWDLLSSRVRAVADMKRRTLSAMSGQNVAIDAEAILSELKPCVERIRPLIGDTMLRLHDASMDGKRFLFEGANGSLLDIDHGTYPYVTSSGTTANNVGNGSGVPARSIANVLGVTKSYATRVGHGPFVTELDNAAGQRIREVGHEYGTTTGRPRRCGWFDAVATTYSVRFGGVTEIALMHLDTLSGFETVGLCTGYRLDGQALRTPPSDCSTLERVEPVFEFVKGWSEDLRSVDSYERLPETARNYIQRIESLVGAPVTIISVGPERTQTIVRNTRVVSAREEAGT